MVKGILLGIVLLVISAVGYLVIVNVTSIENVGFRNGLILELVPGRIKLASPGIRDLAGFLLLVAGSVIIVSKHSRSSWLFRRRLARRPNPTSACSAQERQPQSADPGSERTSRLPIVAHDDRVAAADRSLIGPKYPTSGWRR